jgi:hypothetical protein
VNGIDANDALAMLQEVQGLSSSPCPGNSDVNCNGTLDLLDVLSILLYAANLPPLPTPSACRAIGT